MSSNENQLETSIYVGNALSAILYGYGAILLLMLTIYGVMIQTFGQLLWITYRDTSGGPPVWLVNHSHSWYGVLASAMTTISNTMGDGLMVTLVDLTFDTASNSYSTASSLLYHTSKKQASSHLPHLAIQRGIWSVVSSIVTTIKDASPQSNFWALTFLPWDVAWISCTAAFNATVTFMICYRIMATNWATRDILPAKVLRTHTGLISMMVEGTIPFTLLGIAYAISEATENVSQICLSRVWMLFCVLSQQFIILRIAMGMAWSEDTVNQVALNMSLEGGEEESRVMSEKQSA
ncbi:hypothetical protein CONPUDRAFT_73165 [Coniophora puteana RWD-64-598 SS2]|uniref:Uncharacterized protein n=1 Tax=Coniophora puteana (strain RWD-64-598) TaxID=741705 RepID=A0A5M3MS05_CONPW|nr:uncharacterized protein CONPUDRAFT_73165 [Coniophora puteana RWD-64-598 SS2]EIW81435.1 hypothetical protein CONPUDRAFT_73165 [Coniophora puteana RWD-64-598 SS2]